jgi:hypothetical protein
MINVYGTRAAMQAAIMAGRMRTREDREGYENWKRIILAIHKLESGKLY